MCRVFRTVFFSILIGVQSVVIGFVGKDADVDSLEKLHKELQEIIAEGDPTAQIGVHILSVKTGKTVFEKNAHHRFIPGAAIKLFTAAAALQILGPSFCFDTRLLTDGQLVEGVLKGNLYIEGSGDPSLVSHSLEDLIFQLKLQNIQEIEGDLVFDASEFDKLPLAPGWMWDEKLQCRDAPVDALTINHSCIKIWVKPAQLTTMSPFIHIAPELPGILIENTAVMKEMEPSKNSISIEKRDVPDKDILQITGEMSLNSRILEFTVPVKQPLLYSATEFSVLLKKNHIMHRGKIRFGNTSESARVLANHLSESLFHLVMHMLKNNDDLYANCLFKKIGRVKYKKPGTWPNGSQSIRDFLVSIGNKDFSDVVVLDGSGESRYNMVTPQFMNEFLSRMYQHFSPEFIASIPLAGVDSALKKRLREKQLSGKVRVLPGTLKGVSSLCGYVTTADKDTLAVTIMTNGFQRPSKEIKTEVEDRICAKLAKFSMKH